MIGYTLHEVKKEHYNTKFTMRTLDTGVAMDGDFGCIRFSYLVPSGSDAVTACIALPLTRGCLSAVIERYNATYVVIDARTWHVYLDGGGVMLIELEYDPESDYYFTYMMIR